MADGEMGPGPVARQLSTNCGHSLKAIGVPISTGTSGTKRPSMQKTTKFNLRLLLETVVSAQPNIEEIYLFGSRAYRTGSLRSDCDLLVSTSAGGNVRASDMREFAMQHCPALDFFIAVDGRAVSCMNDSYVYSASLEELTKKLDAIKLWTKANGFTDFQFDLEAKWVFSTSIDVVHVPTVLPSGHISELSWQTLIKRTEQEGLPIRPFIGDTVDKATVQITDIATRMLMRPSELGQRGKAKSGWTVSLASEYDCQNLFLTVVKPWIPSLAREETEIIYDDQKKNSDFSLFEGKLIVEMKYIDSDDKKREVVKTLDGLSRFYSRNANVSCLLMLIYTTSNIQLDRAKWEADYSFFATKPTVITKVIQIP